MKTQEKISKDKTYVLNGSKTPVSFFVQSRSNKRRQLLHFDEEKGINRALRYSKNQRSIFEDEQDGTAILEPIVMEDGKIIEDGSFNQLIIKDGGKFKELWDHQVNGMVL